jgi:oxygen-independent coproporphyrinogen-3 oxidase
MTEIGLYIHVPFCATKCGYCDFYSAVPTAGAFEPLVDALLTEIHQTVDRRDARIVTIFAGGGTPTLLPAPSLHRLFAELGKLVAQHRPIEFTVEANPASMDEQKAAILKENGVTRISMGAQSFHPNELHTLERIHSPQDIAQSSAIIYRAGFAHFNLDLIFGIPGQTPESLGESLQQAIELGPDHLSCYGLTFEPGTPLYNQRETGANQPMDEDLETELYTLAMDRLTAAGFEQYEISNYAKPGGRCEHNLRYWRNQPVISVGPSAASYFEGRRWKNVPDTAEYVRRMRSGLDPTLECEMLSPYERAGETAMLQLRLIEGIGCAEFERLTGFDPHRLFQETIARHAEAGLLSADAHRIALTRTGRLVADAIMADFLAPSMVSTS